MSAEGPRVLIVDDEPGLVTLLSDFLGDEFSVSTATNGREALDQIDDSIDLVCLDRRMPKLSGDEVVRRIRQEDWSCKVLMVTSIGADDSDLGGWDGYLEKPVTMAEFRTAIDRLLDPPA